MSDELLGAALTDCPALGRVFTYRWLVDRARYPQRQFWMQHNEPLTDYLFRQWKRAGISWFFQPLADDPEGRIELVLFDDPMRLAENAAGEVRYQRLDGTVEADAITMWADVRQLTSGAVEHRSWNYKAARVETAGTQTLVEHGELGSKIAAYLSDTRIVLPHEGDDAQDFTRLSRLSMLRHEADAAWAVCFSGHRSTRVGEYNAIAGHPTLDLLPLEQRQHVWTEIHHVGHNARLKGIDERASRLLEDSQPLPDWAPVHRLDDASHSHEKTRYLHRAIAVQRGTPLTPAWDARRDMPRLQPMTVVIVGPKGETVHTDELNRVKAQFQGEETGRASAWMRFNAVYAGAREGLLLPLKCGMEASVEWESGDESRPVITRVHYNQANPPPHFDHAGGLPGNRYMAGLHLHEIGSQRYGELVFDMTRGQISVALGSEHAYSRLQMGELRDKRHDGRAQPIGEGFYLQTQASGAIRSLKSMLISTWRAARQLGAEGHHALIKDGLALFKSMGGLRGPAPRDVGRREGAG